jgi:hypothetical protein
MNVNFAEFIRERNEALASLDEARIRAYARKYNSWVPDHPETFWRAVHKAITAIPELPLELRRKSKAWLEARGSQPWGDS